MSSATVLYVLERIMKRKPQAGELGLMLSFGWDFQHSGFYYSGNLLILNNGIEYYTSEIALQGAVFICR